MVGSPRDGADRPCGAAENRRAWPGGDNTYCALLITAQASRAPALPVGWVT